MHFYILLRLDGTLGFTDVTKRHEATQAKETWLRWITPTGSPLILCTCVLPFGSPSPRPLTSPGGQTKATSTNTHKHTQTQRDWRKPRVVRSHVWSGGIVRDASPLRSEARRYLCAVRSVAALGCRGNWQSVNIAPDSRNPASPRRQRHSGGRSQRCSRLGINGSLIGANSSISKAHRSQNPLWQLDELIMMFIRGCGLLESRRKVAGNQSLSAPITSGFKFYMSCQTRKCGWAKQ